MTVTPPSPASSQQAAVDAALLILGRMGLSPDDLTASPRNRASVPTFAEYVPVVSAAATDGTRKAYGSYWNRVAELSCFAAIAKTSAQKPLDKT